jgi:lysophospholipase L1-like esterase
MLFVTGLLLWLLGPRVGRAQSTQDSLQAAYPFLRTSANHIEGAVHLQRFYQRLARLPGGQVSVVHLGDSHVQADGFPGRLRQELQRTYGNAGRGLVFPYQVAHTAGSPTFRTAATGGRWQAQRLVQPPKPALPVGVSGFVLATPDVGAGFTLRISPRPLPGYRFTTLTLLREPGPAAFDWEVSSAQGRVLGTLPGKSAGIATALRLDSLRGAVALRTARSSPRQTSARLYGLVLANGQPGVLYHAIGVNGAAVRDYNRAPAWAGQLPVLAPDLFIVSLGTNDAYKPGFDPMLFGRQLDTLMSRLRRHCPEADVLLTAPADSYRARGARNPDLTRLRAVLRRYCATHAVAYWDFAAVQGGEGAMEAWQAHGLAQPDGLHFTTRGYAVQGLLLYLALQDGFAAPLR